MGELKPYLAVFIIQLIYSGLTLLSKAAFNGGMNTCVFISYRQLTGTVIMVPLALILERLTLALNMQAIALVYTSATLAAAIVNSLPASTFFFAVQGALVTGVSYYLQAWVIEKRGPFSQVMWNPLSFILATTGSILFLGEPLFWEGELQ
ncbi:hypothetical protein glysoja_011851 [Glycine soja]|nr:hypothetical protein glysoja_011851 [Glycine soja]